MTRVQQEFDIETLIAVRAGDAVAFARLYRRYSVVVLRYAWNRLGEQAGAEDITQETFVVVWLKRKSAFIVEDSLLPWILTIARNLTANELRKRARRRTVATESVGSISGRAVAHEDLAWLGHEFAKLSEIDQQLCRLCLIQGLSYKEAAERLGSSEAAVSKRIQRARARLRVALGSDD